MNNRIPACLLALILVLAQSPVVLWAQTNSSGQQQPPQPAVQNWQELASLSPGKKVLVEFKSGSTLDAKFVRVTGSQLTLSEGGSDYNLEQRDIRRVFRLKGRWSRARLAKIGAGIGMIVGTFIGTGIMIRAEGRPGYIPSDEDSGAPVAGFVLGTLGGMGAGALLGGKRKGKLLYEAQ